jgi:hypothetical protein
MENGNGSKGHHGLDLISTFDLLSGEWFGSELPRCLDEYRHHFRKPQAFLAAMDSSEILLITHRPVVQQSAALGEATVADGLPEPPRQPVMTGGRLVFG